uniref:Uncharacterized protein n=1 Tax=Meloidogyne enterolobii TaxID=390850 RepID=A0A6V7TQ65_MELEN|nr:unnamed protein product [Meloidogyne enterolobii]
MDNPSPLPYYSGTLPGNPTQEAIPLFKIPAPPQPYIIGIPNNGQQQPSNISPPPRPHPS